MGRIPILFIATSPMWLSSPSFFFFVVVDIFVLGLVSMFKIVKKLFKYETSNIAMVVAKKSFQKREMHLHVNSPLKLFWRTFKFKQQNF